MSEDGFGARRNPRVEMVGRDFICPCGKAYLSYPALFTHIKQKHDGKAPGPIIRPKPGAPRTLRPPPKPALTPAH
jgi:hypothetical protein